MIYIRQNNETHSWYRKASVPLLAFCWIGGLVSGLACAAGAEESTFSLMRTAPYAGVSIVSLLGCRLLPFLISAFAVYISAPWLILPISFGKAFCFSLCASLLTMAYGSAGWLLRLLLMFSDFCLCPVLLWFWVRCIRGQQPLRRKDLTVSVIAVVFAVYMDQTFVSPFLQAVLKF